MATVANTGQAVHLPTEASLASHDSQTLHPMTLEMEHHQCEHATSTQATRSAVQREWAEREKTPANWHQLGAWVPRTRPF